MSVAFNVLQKFRAVKDTIVAAGPGTLRQGADLLQRVVDSMRMGAQWIEAVGPMIQFSPGGDTDDEKLLADYEALATECEAMASTQFAMKQKMTDGARINQMAALDPGLKSLILSLIADFARRMILKWTGSASLPAAHAAYREKELEFDNKQLQQSRHFQERQTARRQEPKEGNEG